MNCQIDGWWFGKYFKITILHLGRQSFTRPRERGLGRATVYGKEKEGKITKNLAKGREDWREIRIKRDYQ